MYLKNNLNKTKLVQILYLVVLVFGVVSISQGIVSLLTRSLNLSLVVILAFLCGFPFIREKNRQIYNPILIISVVYFIRYGLGYLYFHYYPSSVPLRAQLNMDMLNRALWHVDLCFLFFLIGYYLINFSALTRKIFYQILCKIPDVYKINLSKRKTMILLIVLLVTGWGARFLLFHLGRYFHIHYGETQLITRYGRVAQILKMFSIYPLVATVLIFLKYLLARKRIFYLIGGSILFILELIYALPTGSKEKVLFPIFILCISYSIIRKTPIKTLIISSLIFCFFIFPFIDIYRHHSRHVSSDFRGSLDVYQNSFLKTYDKDTIIGAGGRVFGGRLNELPIVAITIEKTPEVWRFQKGYTYALFFPALIPRVLWPGKPNITINTNQFAREYGIVHPNDYVTSVGPGWIGEMYLNFAWFDIVMAFVFGVLYKFIFVYFFRHGKPNILGIILYSFAFYPLVRSGMVAPLFSGLLQSIAGILIVCIPFLVIRRKRI